MLRRLPRDLLLPIVELLQPADYTAALCLSRSLHDAFSSPPISMPKLVRVINNWPAVLLRVSRCQSLEQLEQLASQFPSHTQSGYPITAHTLLAQLRRLVEQSFLMHKRVSQPFPFRLELAQWLDLHPAQLEHCGFRASSNTEYLRSLAQNKRAPARSASGARLEEVMLEAEIINYFRRWHYYQIPLDREFLVARVRRENMNVHNMTYLPIHTGRTIECAIWGDPNTPAPPPDNMCWTLAKISSSIYHSSEDVPFTKGRYTRAVPILNQYRDCGCVSADSVMIGLMGHVKFDPRFTISVWTCALNRATVCTLLGRARTRRQLSEESLGYATPNSPVMLAFLAVRNLASWALWAYVAIATGGMLTLELIDAQLRRLSLQSITDLRLALSILGLKPHNACCAYKSLRNHVVCALGDVIIGRSHVDARITCSNVVLSHEFWYEPQALFRSVRRISNLVVGGTQWSRALCNSLDWTQLHNELDPAVAQMQQFVARSHNLVAFLKHTGKYLGARWPAHIVRRAMLEVRTSDEESDLDCVIKHHMVPADAHKQRIDINWDYSQAFRVLDHDVVNVRDTKLIPSEYHLPRDVIERVLDHQVGTKATLWRLMYGLPEPFELSLQHRAALTDNELMHAVPLLLAAGRWNEVSWLLQFAMEPGHKRVLRSDLTQNKLFVEYIAEVDRKVVEMDVEC